MVNAFMGMSVIGWFASIYRINIPIVSTIYNFILANVGFLVGVIRALSGHSIKSYKKG